jgi:hypothetical protein
MKKCLVALLFMGVMGSAFAQRLSTVGILPFEAGEGAAAGDAASLTRQVINELGSWGTITVLEGGQVQSAEYLVRGTISRQGNMFVLTASTAQGNKTLNEAKEQAAAISGIPIPSFCAQAMANVPFPNYLLGTWQCTINLPDTPLVCIIEFKTDRTVRIERYDTWEHKQNNALKYEGYGTGTYSYAGYMRRGMSFKDAQGQTRQVQVDAVLGVNLKLEETLPEQTSVNQGGMWILFNDAKTAFEFVNFGFPCGRNYDGERVYPASRVSFIQFVKIR